MNIEYYLNLKNVERLATSYKIQSYNVLEHSYMVTVLFRYFASRENVAYDIHVLDAILHHDILESVTGDLIYTVKNMTEHTKDLWEELEDEVVGKHFQLENYTDSKLREVMNKRQYQLFKACDLLDLWIFLKNEITLGNKTKKILEYQSRCYMLLVTDYNFTTINQFMEGYRP